MCLCDEDDGWWRWFESVNEVVVLWGDEGFEVRNSVPSVGFASFSRDSFRMLLFHGFSTFVVYISLTFPLLLADELVDKK